METLIQFIEAAPAADGIQPDELAELGVPPDDEVIIYCDCPNDASAAVAARTLQEKGFSRVRPLAGGIDAWRARGLPVERELVSERPPDAAPARVPTA